MAGKQRAVLVSLNISIWDARTKDVALGHELAQAKNADDACVRVWKSLLPGCETLGKLVSLRTQARRFHYENTFPAQHRGVGILPVKNITPYTTREEEYRERFYGMLPTFKEECESIQDKVRVKLGYAYKASDYPPSSAIIERCRFDVVFSPMPEGGIALPEELSEEERRRIERSTRESMEAAQMDARKDLRKRLYDVVADMEDKLGKPKDLRLASIKHLESMLALLGRLNMDEDEEFEKLRKDAENRLAAAVGSSSSGKPKSGRTKRAGRSATPAGTAKSSATSEDEQPDRSCDRIRAAA
ncbi:hypothetical protein B1A_07744 [mine drainage metagenome]|uniref:Uncharacterized protein n=1 Tax=mine drainage metagenome TaxID=410659 RepID=T1BBU5_9ZZZZ